MERSRMMLLDEALVCADETGSDSEALSEIIEAVRLLRDELLDVRDRVRQLEDGR